MDRPPADPVKLLEHWMEWEKGDATPGTVMKNLKVGGLRHPAMVSGSCIYIQSPPVAGWRYRIPLCEADLGLAAPPSANILWGKSHMQGPARHERH